jgi:Tol biopolymer transport system component
VIGATLSHYRITEALGAGGMGEVYRATDTNLNREVAIKVLPSEVAQDPERLARFRREAQLLAVLNHPHIAAIYGLEQADERPFLALELVEGEDLKQRLARGAIPVQEALEIAEQIAEALEEAHSKGIIHRDLKPANVKLTPTGQVKVLDFGLAKAWAGDGPNGSSSPALSQSPTMANTGTVAGVILGTAGYMSPEQARGKPVDKRADVWSFGVLLWEMLSGRTLFTGDTVTDVIAAVVREEPDLEALPKKTPAAVRSLIARSLRKDPRTRLPDIGAVRLDLQDVLAGAVEDDRPAAEVETAVQDVQRKRWRERWAWLSLVLLTVAVAATLAVVLPRKAPPRLAAHFTIDLPDGWRLMPDFGWPIPSPDGRQVAFRAEHDADDNGNGQRMIWVRPLESMEARPLSGTEGADAGPFWSPDSRFIVFVVGEELRKLSLVDRTVQRICTLPPGGVGAADWSANGTILVSAGGTSGRIYKVAASGGELKPVTTLDTGAGDIWHHFPQFLPDGRHFLFVINGPTSVAGLYVASMGVPEERRRIASGVARYVYASGHILFPRDGTLLAQPFDVGSATLAGEPAAVASPVAGWSQIANLGWFGASPAGTLAYISGQSASGRVQLTWVDRVGQRIATVGEPGMVGQIALSPDHGRVAYEVPDGSSSDLWVMDLNRGVATRVTATPEAETDPVWAPDGQSLVFAQQKDGKSGLRRKGLRVADPVTKLTDGEYLDYPEFWSADGKTVLFDRQRPSVNGFAILALALDGKKEPTSVVDTGFFVDEPQISPDGRWLAYTAGDSGRPDVYVEPYGRPGARTQVSPAGGGEPKWRADGKELFYLQGASLVAVEIKAAGDTLDVGLPTKLFDIPIYRGPGLDDYAVGADGQRFLIKAPLTGHQPQKIHVITNWTSLLK